MGPLLEQSVRSAKRELSFKTMLNSINCRWKGGTPEKEPFLEILLLLLYFPPASIYRYFSYLSNAPSNVKNVDKWPEAESSKLEVSLCHISFFEYKKRFSELQKKFSSTLLIELWKRKENYGERATFWDIRTWTATDIYKTEWFFICYICSGSKRIRTRKGFYISM